LTLTGLTKKFAVVILFFTVHCSLFTVSFADTPKRIISLAPNITEILFALGVDERLTAVSSFCDFPEEAKKKPKVGGMSNPSLEAVVSLRPDLVLFSIDGNPKPFEERLRNMKIPTFTLRSKRITELPHGVRQIGAAVGAEARAEILAQEMDTKIAGLKDRERRYRELHRTAKKQKVLFIIWPDPLIVAGPGSIADDALQILGTENIAAKTGTTYPKYSIEEILRQAPDIIFIGKGMGMDKVADGLLRRLKSVPAVRSKKVFYVSDYLYRLGPRTIQGIEELAGHLEQ
jgi:iron complex transport system substrate-binding protein